MIFSIILLIWIICHMFGFLIMGDMIDYYMDTEYETHSLVLHMILPIVFVIKFRKNIPSKILKGLKVAGTTFTRMFKIIKFKKGE